MANTFAADDAVLINQARAGDEQAFATLWERHEGAARRLAGTYARNDADRDDLVSIAFERVLSAVRSGGGPNDSFRAYLFVTLRRAAAEVATRREEPPPQGLIDLALEAEAPLEGHERELVTQAFESLPDRWQTVLWHTAVEGRAPRELAPRLGVSANAAAAMAYRAREKLRQAYLQAHLQQRPRAACEPFVPQLGAYVRGALGTRDHRAVEAHVDGCAHCQGLLVELRDVNSLLLRAVLPILATGGLKAAAVAAGAAGAGAAVAGGAAAGSTGGSGGGVGLLGWFSGRAGPGPQAGAVAGAAAAAAAVVVAAVAFAGGFTSHPHHARLTADRPPATIVAPSSTAAPDPPTTTTEPPTTTTEPPSTTTTTTVAPTTTAPRRLVVPPVATTTTTVASLPEAPPPPPPTTTTTTTTTTRPAPLAQLGFDGHYGSSHPGLRSTTFTVTNAGTAAGPAAHVRVTFTADHGAVETLPGSGWTCGTPAGSTTCTYAPTLDAGGTSTPLGFTAAHATELTIAAVADDGSTASVTLH